MVNLPVCNVCKPATGWWKRTPSRHRLRPWLRESKKPAMHRASGAVRQRSLRACRTGLSQKYGSELLLTECGYIEAGGSYSAAASIQAEGPITCKISLNGYW